MTMTGKTAPVLESLAVLPEKAANCAFFDESAARDEQTFGWSQTV